MMFIGVDIGGTAVKLGIVDEKGSILHSTSYEVSFDNYKTPIMDTVIRSMCHFLATFHISINDVHCIGVSATGQIDTKHGIVIGGNIASWVNVNVKEQLEKEFNIHTSVINDANAMIIGESWIGAAAGRKNVVGITVGTGVGGGILVDGNILLGDRGIAGELGHIVMMKDGVPCACGNTGCYERYAATTALIQMVKDTYAKSGITEKMEDINGKLIFDYADKGNEIILSILDQWIDNIAIGLVSLVHIFNPEIIVVGGGVCQQKDQFMKPLRRKVLEKVMPRFKEQLGIQPAVLKNNAGLVGAVYYAMNHMEE